MIASVIANYPGHARPTVMFRGEAPAPRMVQTLLESAKRQGGKATICLDGAKMLNLAHYEHALNAARVAAGAPLAEDETGPKILVTEYDHVTEEILGLARTLARTKRFQLTRISWQHFFAAMEGARLRGGATLVLGPGPVNTNAKRKIARHIRDMRAYQAAFQG